LFDAQIAKAVEVEVARRLEEREKERVREEEERRAKELQQQAAAAERETQPVDEPSKQTLPSGVLTPLLKRHRDLDDELKMRLQELEAKM
jgi:kinesin family protein 22